MYQGHLFVDDRLLNGDLTLIENFVTGGSGIARGIPHNFIGEGLASGRVTQAPPVSGSGGHPRGQLLARDARQIAYHAERHPSRLISVGDLMRDSLDVGGLTDFVRENEGRLPLLYSSSDPAHVAAAQQTYGREAVADKLDGLLAHELHRLLPWTWAASRDCAFRSIVITESV